MLVTWLFSYFPRHGEDYDVICPFWGKDHVDSKISVSTILTKYATLKKRLVGALDTINTLSVSPNTYTEIDISTQILHTFVRDEKHYQHNQLCRDDPVLKETPAKIRDMCTINTANKPPVTLQLNEIHTRTVHPTVILTMDILTVTQTPRIRDSEGETEEVSWISLSSKTFFDFETTNELSSNCFLFFYSV